MAWHPDIADVAPSSLFVLFLVVFFFGLVVFFFGVFFVLFCAGERKSAPAW